jgi:hypothetical protein
MLCWLCSCGHWAPAQVSGGSFGTGVATSQGLSQSVTFIEDKTAPEKKKGERGG